MAGTSAKVAARAAMLRQLPTAIALAFAVASTARAQVTADVRAAVALRATHIGALVPLMTPAMVSRRLNGAQLGLRYGLLDEGGVRTQAIAAAVTFLAGLESSVTLNAGVRDGDCGPCAPALMLGAGADMRIFERGAATGPQLSAAVAGDLGYAQLKPGDESAVAFSVGVPVSLSFATGGREGLHVVPFVTPGFGAGKTSDPCLFPGCPQSGTRFLIGGGIGVWNPLSNLSASIGINQVVIEEAQPVFGVNVTFGGR